MKMVWLVIAFVLLLAAVVFGMQNTMPLTIHFLFWEGAMSLTAVVLYAFCIGALCALTLTIPRLVKTSLRMRRLSKRLPALNTATEA